MFKRMAILVVLIVAMISIVLLNNRNHQMSNYWGQTRQLKNSPVYIPFHGQPIKGGFILVYDKPVVCEYDGNTVSVLAIGRAKVPKLKPNENDGVKPQTYRVETPEKMIILLKIERSNALFGDIDYMETEESNETQGGDWRSNEYMGAGWLDLPFDTFQSHIKDNKGWRIQPIVCSLPARGSSRFSIEDPIQFWASLEAKALDISAKPLLGPVSLQELKDRTLSIANCRLRLCDYLISNPALLPRTWFGENYTSIPANRSKECYLTLRFYTASGSSNSVYGIYALVYGANGEKVLMKTWEQWLNIETPRPYLGMEVIGGQSYSGPGIEAYHEHDLGCIDPTGPAARAGVRDRDRVIETGEGTSGNRCIELRIESAQLGVPLVFNITRGNETREMVIMPAERPEENLILKGMEKNRSAIYAQMVSDIPHIGNAKTGIRMAGGRVGGFTLVSYDPLPADFKPVKVAFYREKYNDPITKQVKTGAVDDVLFTLPEIPIPNEFWK